jgi:hypothetical protein
MATPAFTATYQKMMEDSKSYHQSLRKICPTLPVVDEPCLCCVRRIEKQFAEIRVAEFERDASLYFTDGKSATASIIPTALSRIAVVRLA